MSETTPPATPAPRSAPPQENPLANILVNVLIPVLVLSYLSKEGDRPWHIGPAKAMIIALALPVGYGIWFFLKTKRANPFSFLGLISVLLTGTLTLYLWNKDGTIKPNAHILFGLKEASIPLVLGLAILASHWTPSPLLRLFLYSDSMFDIPKIEKTVAERGVEDSYRKLLFGSTVLFSSSFLVSTVLNFLLALYFLGGLDHTALDARERYNAQVAKLTGWSFAVIGVPILLFLMFTLWRLLTGLRRLTGLDNEHLLHPR
jgi:hypothetical protein